MPASARSPLSSCRLTRRDFLQLLSVSALGMLNGCTENPVTGQRQLMLVSEGQEVSIDREQSPHQFSADYGTVQDARLNGYLASVGGNLARNSHRPEMPYSFRGVNANTINAYAFPGGSIAATRGILLELNDEAELAALLGHEIGHVNARHAAQRMSTGIVTQLAVAGATAVVAVSEDQQGLAPLVQTLGGLSAGALLARYSRENEREADALGMAYAARAGQNPAGMVGLHRLLVEQGKNKANALELMFATHPMSSERLATAQAEANGRYRQLHGVDRRRERYMDNTATLRRLRPAVLEQQNGEKEMAGKNFSRAEPHFARALQLAPEDYTGLLLMAKCQFALDKKQAASQYAEQAKRVYPGEAQALHVAGIASLSQGKNQAALKDFDAYDRLLPGNPNLLFLKGVALEGLGQREAAAGHYQHYLQEVRSGGQSQYARQRLVQWGFIKAQ